MLKQKLIVCRLSSPRWLFSMCCWPPSTPFLGSSTGEPPEDEWQMGKAVLLTSPCPACAQGSDPEQARQRDELVGLVCRVVEALVSVRRLSEFLRCPESTGPSPTPPWGGSGSSSAGMDGIASSPALAVKLSGSFSWGGSGTGLGTNAGSTVLQVAELALPSGALVALTGPVGSGKSSLLAAVLGEMRHSASSQQQGASRAPDIGGCGSVTAGSSVAYVPQDPWIMHGALRWAAPCIVLVSQPEH